MKSAIRKQHPADRYNDELLARAVRYDVALFVGVGRYERASAGTLDEARVLARHMEARTGAKRKALIYGVTADNRAGLIAG